MNNTVHDMSLLMCLILFLPTAVRDHYYPPHVETKKEPDAPVFRSTEQNYTVGPGDKAKLTCRVDHLGTKTVSKLPYTSKNKATLVKEVIYCIKLQK